MKRILPCLLSASALACAAYVPQALAGEFSVAPVRVEFNAGARSQLVTLTNAGGTPSRFLVRAVGWTMTEAGEVQTMDDDRLVVFPSSFTVGPKLSQNLRVGTDQRAGDVEKTWRIIFEELPDPNASSAGGSVINVLSVISVPVFMPPVKVVKAAKLSVTGADAKALKVSLVNEGNATEVISAVTATALRGEQPAQQGQITGWYLLPGNKRTYSIPGDKAWCELGAARFELRATNVQGDTVATQTVDAREACR